ncbi:MULTISPECIES: DUF1173 domain-containing protein [Burkholderia]|uniref:DUF1173 domain-containing protein n=1 Tax=Burkholderia pseudomallei TaxID=28450 RepID=A0A0C5B4K4_BURPE|nr:MULTISPECIES: DUF1173 domain-containing protein [Burkholderia]AJL34976.1 hypothetical protein pBPS093 [Burkholderia pseudomallei]KWK68782.1 hypothetical protein WM15_06190 [Burkholderia ubonensis]
MLRFEIDGRTFSGDDPGLQGALARVHRSKIRPLCLCVRPGIPMYVAKVEGHYLIKRMPDSGASHSADCTSYEPPAQLSGLGEVMGHAIQEDIEDGTTSLRLDFALNKIGGRAPPAPSNSEQDSIKAETSKLTIRSLLHYLWDEAHLTHWHPAMEGKRSWATVHKYLLRAAQGKFTKGLHLPSSLYVPEPYYVDRKHEIEQRRSALLASGEKSNRPGKKLFIAIGEIKIVEAARYGHKIELKQAPDFFFMMSSELNKRLKVFAAEKSLWNAFPEIHLVMIATFSVDTAGVADLEEMALMVTNEQWIPFSNVEEKRLLESLIKGRRRFVKGLRYNLPSTRPLASVILNDTEDKHTAVYMVPGNASETYMTALGELLDDNRMHHVQWAAGDAMPVLPPAVSRSGVEAV